jgi:hypothetical protein
MLAVREGNVFKGEEIRRVCERMARPACKGFSELG